MEREAAAEPPLSSRGHAADVRVLPTCCCSNLPSIAKEQEQETGQQGSVHPKDVPAWRLRRSWCVRGVWCCVGRHHISGHAHTYSPLLPGPAHCIFLRSSAQHSIAVRRRADMQFYTLFSRHSGRCDTSYIPCTVAMRRRDRSSVRPPIRLLAVLLADAKQANVQLSVLPAGRKRLARIS